ncbi:MAG: M48 family metallopeptidase [Candidatus Eisenbacteria bacterium]|uniref:M48 family metallopeptidase n=1 Tax=Eiseniibacteriota bacterium TaxID=2212470 RepID=A0A7Y2H0Y3_UNCEI|nr:M48 family metallopeptidase [Candidatus Eisenbacteria bacterium]
MNFFEHQDQARRNTKRLVFYFFAATGLIVLAVMAIVAIVMVPAAAKETGATGFDAVAQSAGPILISGLAALGLIGMGSLSKTASLRGGGGVVARQLGGSRVEPDDMDPSRRRLMNIVEEMSIASGMPVPEVYVLENESAINAFAAGFNPGDAAIAVTRGSMERLTRDELQGVIAHEYSHIFNGDMKLNMRLIGILHGILLIGLTGRLLFRGMAHVRLGNRREKDSGGIVIAIFVAGLAMIILGSIGVFFGRLIKAAVSRQREFLADASGVQFTRNPLGLAGALKKIGGFEEGSRLEAARTEEVSHMLFGPGSKSFAGMFATHPPLEERILKLDPAFKSEEYERIAQEEAVRLQSADVSAQVAGFAAADSIPIQRDTVVESIGNPSEAHFEYARGVLKDIPVSIREALLYPRNTVLLVMAMILGSDPKNRSRQMQLLEHHLGRNALAPINMLAEAVHELGPAYRLPILDLAIPVLRRLPAHEIVDALEFVQELASVDGEIDFFEFVLARMLQTHLFDAVQSPSIAQRHRYSIEQFKSQVQTVLAATARVGHPEEEVHQAYVAGFQTLGVSSPGAVPALNMLQLDKALVELDALKPKDKQRLLEAMVASISHDQQVTVEESEILRAVCDTLHIPLPPLEAQASPLNS